MRNHHDIVVRFIRRTDEDGSDHDADTDDVLKIVHQQNNMLRFIYTERSGDEADHDTSTFTHHDAISHMYRMFWITSLDEDPFRSIQFFLPSFPSFLVSVAVVKQNMNQILDLFLAIFRSWPAVSNQEGGNERTGGHSTGNHVHEIINNTIPPIQQNQNE